MGADQLTITASDPLEMSIAVTVQISEQTIITPQATLSPTAINVPVNMGKNQETQSPKSWFWIMGGGILLLIFLLYILYREWNKPTAPTEEQ